MIYLHFFSKILFSFRYRKHIGILSCKDEEEVIIEMPTKMDPTDFQNVVDDCCGLFALNKWGIVHTDCYNSDIEQHLINASAQHCSECGSFTSGVVSLVRHNEKYHSASACYICALCCLPYVTKVALDCHVVRFHGSVGKARNDYDRKYKL